MYRGRDSSYIESPKPPSPIYTIPTSSVVYSISVATPPLSSSTATISTLDVPEDGVAPYKLRLSTYY